MEAWWAEDATSGSHIALAKPAAQTSSWTLGDLAAGTDIAHPAGGHRQDPPRARVWTRPALRCNYSRIALPTRRVQPGSVEPAAGTRNAPQSGGDLADRAADAGFQQASSASQWAAPARSA
jgi:hypothetical protein